MKIQIKATIHIDTDEFEGEFNEETYDIWDKLEDYIVDHLANGAMDIDFEDMYAI